MSQQKPSTMQVIRSFLVWMCFFYVVFWAISSFTQKDEPKNTESSLILKSVKKRVTQGNIAEFKLTNKTETPIALQSACSTENLSVVGLLGGSTTENLYTGKDCQENLYPNIEIAAGKTYTLSFKEFQHHFFTEPGNYQVTLKAESNGEIQDITSSKIEILEPGFFRKIFRALVIKPLFNLLVFLVQILPNHSLGIAIIVLTLTVRLLLFMPNQKAMASQRELQKLQPKIEELKAKHKDNQQAVAMKTMELYKTHKINPMSSLLPILLQFPFLLGTYFIVMNGIAPYKSQLLYSFQQNADLSVINNQFTWLDLSLTDPYYILPVLVGLSQFAAIKLAMPNVKKPQTKSDPESFAGQMQQVQKTMMYVFPVMIGVFTAIFPTGVGLYWFTSTLFGVGQQKLVNHMLDKQPQVIRKNPEK